jgi:hypothetical protein
MTSAAPIITEPPVAGELFREVARLDTERVGGNRRKPLLALLAAYADAGEERPPVRLLAKQAKLGSWQNVVQLLKRLEADGWIEVEWASGYGQRNRYRVTLDGGGRAP